MADDDMKNPWDIKKEDFPIEGTTEDKIRFILGYAILAPSTHNSQPWLFKIGADSVKIYFDPKLKLPEADPKGRDLFISMGCMLENLSIAANYFGMLKELRIVLKDNLLAEAYFQANDNINPAHNIDNIPNRLNARGLFDSKVIPGEIKSEIISLNKSRDIRVDLIEDPEKIGRLAELTARGLRLAYRKPSFRKEMYGWMHNSLTRKKSGLPGYSLRMPFVASFILPVLVRFFDISPLLAKLNYKSVASAPLICMFSSEETGPETWVRIGMLAQGCMLCFRSGGVKTSIFVASIEIGDLYKEVRELMGTNLTPQFLFCAGYMSGAHLQRHSPRYSLEDKLI